MTITSRQNEHIKQIRKLRHRPQRQQAGLAYIEGVRIVGEAVQLGADIDVIVVAPDLLKSQFALDLVHQRERSGTPVLRVGADVFRSLSEKDRPQGLAAVVRQRWERLDHMQSRGELCWVALDAVQDPGNLGTILRTSEAIGGAGVFLLGHSTDPYDPEAIRASMGAIFSQRLVRTDALSLSGWARSRGILIAGTSPDATLDYRAARYGRPVILLMGSERQGLSAEDRALCDLLVKIPMVGRADSLNLAVATAIVLYEIFEQSRPAG